MIFSTDRSASPELVRINPGIVLPWRLRAEGMVFEDDLSVAFDATVELSGPSRAYELVRLTVSGDTEFTPDHKSDLRITTVMLQGLSVPRIIRGVIDLALPDDWKDPIRRKAPSYYQSLKTGRLTPQLLREVALRAAAAEILLGTPNREVMECFDVPKRTATYWISRAVSAGFLGGEADVLDTSDTPDGGKPTLFADWLREQAGGEDGAAAHSSE